MEMLLREQWNIAVNSYKTLQITPLRVTRTQTLDGAAVLCQDFPPSTGLIQSQRRTKSHVSQCKRDSHDYETSYRWIILR